jgi:hypothetical protein
MNALTRLQPVPEISGPSIIKSVRQRKYLHVYFFVYLILDGISIRFYE